MENNPEEKLFQIKAEMPAEVVLTNYLVKITFKIFEIHRVNILAMFLNIILMKSLDFLEEFPKESVIKVLFC